MNGRSSVWSSNPFRIRSRSGSVYDAGVAGRRVKSRCETPALGTFGHPEGRLLETRTSWYRRLNRLLGR